MPHGALPVPTTSTGDAVLPPPRAVVAPAVVESNPAGIQKSQSNTLIADASGTVTMQFVAEPFGTQVLLDLVVVQSTSTTPSAASVYSGDVDPQNLRDYTPSGNTDVGPENPAILVPGGRRVTIQWTGVSVGASCTGTIQYRLMGA